MKDKREKYIYDEELEIIYELDEQEIYNPIIFVKCEEKDCSNGIEARTRLDFLKENMLDYYVGLCEENELKKHIDEYLDELFDTYKLILSQMGIQEPTTMDKMLAMDMAREACG